MPLIATPRFLARRAELYHQLGSLTAAGVGLITAVGMLIKSPPSPAFRQPLTQLLQQLELGATFGDALSRLGPRWMPRFDLALLHAGEMSGRLDSCFRQLASYYEERAQMARQILSELAYPAFILHFAILLFPVSLLTRLVWQGDVVGYLMAKIALLGPCYAALLILLYLGQAQRGEWWRSALEQALRCIPVLGVARMNLALSRLSTSLEGLLSAGVSIVESWPLAAAASGSPALRRVVRGWTPQVEAGQTPAEVIRQSGAFPDLFANLYATGEMSGQLEETLHRLSQHYREEASRQLQAIARWTPRLVYFGVVLLVAYQVLSFWMGYFSQLNGIMDSP
jgi:type II secretory pathway component PulF